MAFKIGTEPIRNVFHLAVSLVALSFTITAAKGSSNATSITSINTTFPEGPCAFPQFLQTNCSSSSSVCEWNLGERISLPLGAFSSPASKFRAVRGTAQWSWSVSKTTIIVSHVQAAILKPLTKTVYRKFQCLKTVGNDNNTFVIRKIELLEHRRNINITFNCIRFMARDKTLVRYKLGSWANSIQDISCLDDNLVLQDFPLISDRYFGLFDCPSALRGGFDILSIYDSQRQRRCYYPKGTRGSLEADCLTKEGIYIDFGRSHNCTNPGIGNHHPSELNLRCHSKPWKEGNFTYVMTSRRARWPHEYGKTNFQCFAYDNGAMTKEEFNLFLFTQPKCEQVLNVKNHFDNSHTFILRIRRKVTKVQKSIWTDRCTFPAAFQGSWIEESTHNGIEKIKIKDGNITFPSGDSFECKERFSFKHKYSGCGFGEGEDRWPIPGRVGFLFDDYTLVSRFTNGCRARITRLGLSSTIDNRVLVYRLSQSEPIVNDGRSAQEYYELEILKRLCARHYLYKQDPYPFWGRNIEKIIHKQPLPAQSMEKCSLVFNSRHDLLSTVAVSDSATCGQGKPNKIYFGCKEPAGVTKTLKIAYNRDCPKKDLAFVCIGKAWKFGHFILLRDIVTQRLNCVWFDKESNAILRLDSSQCSDVDWGQLPGRAEKYAERLRIKYFEKCPSVQDPTVRVIVHNTCSLICHSLWMTGLVISLSLIVLHS